jgi:hypothetical protein
VFHKGTKLMWTQTTVRYGYVYSSSFGAGVTTVTIVVNTDYVIANAAITLPYYSYADHPQSFPDWFNWTPTFTGFSTPPSATQFFRFRISGHACTLAFDTGSGSTSNAATFTMTIPVTAATVAAWTANWEAVLMVMYDNGVLLTTSGRGTITEGGTTVDFYSNSGNGAWTAANGKRARSMLTYEI